MPPIVRERRPAPRAHHPSVDIAPAANSQSPEQAVPDTAFAAFGPSTLKLRHQLPI